MLLAELTATHGIGIGLAAILVTLAYWIGRRNGTVGEDD